MTPFRDWKAQGLCRYVGITTTFKSDYDAAEAVLRREKPDFFQVDYSLADREAEKRLLPAARDAGAAVLTALPFGRSSVFAAVRGKSVPEWAREFDATTWPQFFLKFLLGHEAVTAVIPGHHQSGPSGRQHQRRPRSFSRCTAAPGDDRILRGALTGICDYGIVIWRRVLPMLR